MKLIPVVESRGYSAFAVEDTPLRFEMSQNRSRRWQWHSWHAVGPLPIGRGVKRTKTEAIAEALASLGLQEEKQA